jgi:hypothetical protein
MFLSESLNLVLPPQIRLIKRIALRQDGRNRFPRMVCKRLDVIQYIDAAIVPTDVPPNKEYWAQRTKPCAISTVDRTMRPEIYLVPHAQELGTSIGDPPLLLGGGG